MVADVPGGRNGHLGVHMKTGEVHQIEGKKQTFHAPMHNFLSDFNFYPPGMKKQSHRLESDFGLKGGGVLQFINPRKKPSTRPLSPKGGFSSGIFFPNDRRKGQEFF